MRKTERQATTRAGGAESAKRSLICASEGGAAGRGGPRFGHSVRIAARQAAQEGRRAI